MIYTWYKLKKTIKCQEPLYCHHQDQQGVSSCIKENKFDSFSLKGHLLPVQYLAGFSMVMLPEVFFSTDSESVVCFFLLSGKQLKTTELTSPNLGRSRLPWEKDISVTGFQRFATSKTHLKKRTYRAMRAMKIMTMQTTTETYSPLCSWGPSHLVYRVWV